jgi:hypothetical protein
LKGTLKLKGGNIRLLKVEQADGRQFCFEIYNLPSINYKQSSLILQASSETEMNEKEQAR